MATSRTLLLAATLLGGFSIGSAHAHDPRVLQNSEAGVIVPNAIPGGEPAHGRPVRHLITPTGLVPRTGSAQGVQLPNSIPGQRAQYGEAQLHTDMTFPRGVIPNSNEGASRFLGSK